MTPEGRMTREMWLTFGGKKKSAGLSAWTSLAPKRSSIKRH